VGQRIRVLIVDDCKTWREWLRSKLGDSDRFRIVEEAGDGIEALEKARTMKPELVLLDIGLPGLSGIETLPLLRAAIPDARIIFLSQNGDHDVVRSALKDGAHGYVLKMRAESDLLPALEAAFEGEIFRSKSIEP
jgi:DNA-binding NarL/FixJ family response regulator